MRQQPKVLVVDDEESVVVTIKAILQLDGYDVATTTSAAEARKMVRDQEFDLVLTDLRLEDGDGLEVLRAVREHFPETVTIMLTGYASLESAIQALGVGACDYLVKPSEPCVNGPPREWPQRRSRSPGPRTCRPWRRSERSFSRR